jgi:glycosyltransferase involved in cell wall biosynthesis
MNVLMLGWEYPPNIAGGLGVACEGLTRAMSQRDVNILFVVPKLLGGEDAGHMHLADSFQQVSKKISTKNIRLSVVAAGDSENVTREGVDVDLQPYANPEIGAEPVNWLTKIEELIAARYMSLEFEDCTDISKSAKYGRNMFEEVARYTSRVVKRYADAEFDVIHAHDWMTYAAGVALQEITGKPLVVHVHSLDYDRSGEGRNQEIYDIERMGVHRANSVIAVSEYTKGILNSVYHVPLENISVVHNGVYPRAARSFYRKEKQGKKVLFLGRVTLQKGPDYFIQAAAKVLKEIPDVTFVMAGTGDMLKGMIDLSHNLGIQEHIHFTGFLKGQEVEEAFNEADLYVMPSVSEPFGISALEAISFDTPVLMSKQSGVGEVVHHSLKFDFWDVDKLADLIINGLLHEELRLDMIDMAKQELGRVRWEAAADRTESIYNAVLQ